MRRDARKPAVSVIVPMYNAARHIGDTLESLASQSLMDFEAIVVDDGSTDESPAIVDAFTRRDRRFSRIAGPAVGSAGAARNIGLDFATGEYLAFLDADDLFAPSMLEKLYTRAKTDDADVVFTGFRSLDDVTGEYKSQPWALRTQYLPARTPFAPEDVADHLFYVTNPANWNKLFRRAFVQQQGVRFQHLRRANDAYFTFVSLAKAKRLSYVAEELIFYRVGNASSLQGSIHETPLEFVAALDGIHEALTAAQLEGRHHRAFINLVATMSLGALARCKTASAFAETYSAIREGLFPKYGITPDALGELFTQDLRRRSSEVIEKPTERWLFDRLASDGPAKPTPVAAAASPPAPVLIPTPAHPRSSGESIDVSVIVPVHNAAPWLHECLLSVLGQSDVSLEVICVNDGSTDDSIRILHEYATSDGRVVVVDQPNSGQSVARNVGMDVARGRYLCFLDSDDYWKLDAISDLVARMDALSLDVLLFDADSFFDAGVTEEHYRAFATYYTRSKAYSDVVTGIELIAAMREAGDYKPSPCLYLVRAGLLEELQLRFIPGIVHEDNPFTFALLTGSTRATHVKKPIYARRVRPGSTMTAGAAERSMRGYFVAYLDMARRLVDLAVPEEFSERIGGVVHQMYASARRHFLELPAQSGDTLRDVAASPYAHVSYQMLKYERDQARKIQQLSKR